MPMDVVKSHICTVEHKVTVKQAATMVWRTAGLRGFYFGLIPTYVRSFFSATALFVTYDYLVKALPM